jgi:hypothetical protein
MMSMMEENIQGLFRQAYGAVTPASELPRQPSGRRSIVARLMMNVVHVMVCVVRQVVMMVMSVMMMDSGRSRRGDQQRCRNDNCQSRENLTH